MIKTRQQLPNRRHLLMAIAVALTMGLLGLVGAGTVHARGTSAVQAQCSAPAWQPKMYFLGQEVSHNGHEWRANFYVVGAGSEPGNSGFPPFYVPWLDLGPCGSTTTTAPTTTTTAPPGSTTTTAPSTTTTTTPPTQAVEAFYSEAGPWAVSTGSASVPGAGATSLWYPTNLGANGYQHPILTWGNGSGEVPSSYAGVLTHLASWGYVVVATNNGQVGSGSEMLAAAQWAVDQNSNEGSIFFEALDPARVGSLGHSQGADGTVFSAANSNGLITSAVPVALVNRILGGDPLPGPTQMAGIDVFIVAGTNDFLVTQAENRAFFDTLPDGAAMGAVVGDGHNSIKAANTRSRGYITAWFKYTLEGDGFARTAFAGSSPELLTRSGWTWQQVKNLP
jgi:hypothetical protein